jgi:ABC-type dipeptide/oligopeptide/nickel transport systems, permease components
MLFAVPVLIVAGVGPFVAPHDPNEFVTSRYGTPGSGHLLGGDQLGRDVLSRVLAGGWLILALAMVGTLIGVLLGALVGVAAGYFRRRTDNVLMRIVDVFLAFPDIIFAVLLLSVIGPSLTVIVIAVALTHAPRTARVFRAAALSVVTRDFITALRLNGVSPFRIIRSDVLPNLTAQLSVEFGLRLPWSVTIIASLSFLGFGLQPPDPNWGAMINENLLGLTTNVWPVLAPAILIAALVIGLNLIGDAVAMVFASGAAVVTDDEVALEPNDASRSVAFGQQQAAIARTSGDV